MKSKVAWILAATLAVGLCSCQPAEGGVSSGEESNPSSQTTSLTVSESVSSAPEETTSSGEASSAPTVSSEDSVSSDPVSSAAPVVSAPSSSVSSEEKEEAEKVKSPLNLYNLDIYTQPYWKGQIVYHESVMVLEDATGVVADIPLLYHADEIISVRKFHLGSEYKEGRDYTLVDGKLHIPEGSAITRTTHSFYYPSNPSSTTMALNPNYGDGFIYFSEGTKFHTLQIAVTYRHSDSYDGPIPAYKGSKLPKTVAALEAGEDLNIVVYGDSICTGANSTSVVNIAPNAKPWFDMFADSLREKYDSRITLVNTSVGGMTSQWGAANAQERAASKRPDLCIIGFGTNDGTQQMSPDDFRKNLQTIMDTVLAKNPDCEFIILGSIVPNKEAHIFYGNQKELMEVCASFEKTGVAFADIFSIHEHFLTIKRYWDMTGNNVNHPNDFLARAYAQLMCATVIKDF